MKKLLLPLLALAALALPARAQQAVSIPTPDPAVAEFARGVKFTVNGYQGGAEVQTNFPVLVRISTAISGFKYSDFYADGSDLSLVDIGFVDAAGNGLAYDIDTWNPSGESLVWVNLPRMTNGTEFAMWYRSSKTGKVLNAANVWGDYTGVWHLNESGSGGKVKTAVKDSSTNALHGAAQGQASSVSAGKIGGSWRIATVYDRVDASIQIDLADTVKNAKVNDLGDTFCASFWVQKKDKETKWCVTGLNRRADGSTAGWGAQIHDDATQLRVYGNGGKNTYAATGKMSGFNTANQWNKIDIIWYNENGTGKMIVYRNGSNKVGGSTLNPATPVAQPSGQPLVMGNFTSPTSDRAWSGELDEVRLIKGVPSAARVQADYDTVNTTAFLTADSVVEVAVVERPIANLQVVDTGATHIQFVGTLSSLGSDEATECSFSGKVWKTADGEPSEWMTFATGLTGGALSRLVKGLDPATAYSYKLKVTNDVDVDSDEVSGSFTTSGVGVSGTGGDMTRVGDDWVHYFRVGLDAEGGITNDYVFTPPSYATSVRALVVGGGGPGGYYAGGGGGAGGYYYNESLGVTPGTGYAIHVGTGGVASASATVYGANGGDSSIVGGNDVNVVMLGGGAGGNGKQNNQTATLAGQNGGSGGGTAWTGYATGSGTADQGNNGGDVPSGQYQQGLAAGGGGAGTVGGSVEFSDKEATKGSGVGGNGRSSDITGESLYYAGGGSGGAKLVKTGNGTGTAGAGGNGGGGTGGQWNETEGSQYATAGVDGFGGGGGGGSTYNADSYQGGDGGDGIVIIRYAAQGAGDGVVNPMISLSDLAYDGMSGNATATYRVIWAGEGHEDADVYAIWGFDPENLDRTNLVANAMIGNGSNPFAIPPLSKKTVYVRLLAKNAGNYTGISPEILSVELYNPRAAEATVSLASVGYTNAVLSVDVTKLGLGAANATISVQVAQNTTFTGDVLSFQDQTTVSAVGAATASAWGLETNTAYYARAVVSNDIHQVYETDPVPLETLVPGPPSGSASNGDPGFTSLSAQATMTDFGPGSGSAAMRLEASGTADFATVASASPWTDATIGRAETLTTTELVSDTAYHLRVCLSNWWGHVVYLPLADTATRAVPFSAAGPSWTASGDTIAIKLAVSAVYDGIECSAALTYGGTEVGTQTVSAAGDVTWSGLAAQPDGTVATIVVKATVDGTEYVRTFSAPITPGANATTVTDVSDHFSAAGALWMRPGDVATLPDLYGGMSYQVLNERFATVSGSTLTALEPGIVGIRCVDVNYVTNIMGVVILPEPIGNGSIYVFDETKHGNNTDAKSWSTPACWRKVGSDTNDSFPQNADDIAILPFYSKTYGFIRHTNDITIGGLYAGMIRPNASIDCTLERFKDVPTKTVTFARTDGQPVRIQVCPNGENNCYSRIRLGGFTIDVVWASDAVIDCGSSETDYAKGPRGFFDVKEMSSPNINTNTLQGVTLTFRGYPGYSIGGNNASGCTAQLYGFWKGTGTLVKEGMGGIVFNNDIGGLSGGIVLKGQKNPGGINAPSAQFSIRGGGATNLAATVYGVVPIGGNGQPTTSNGAGLFGTSAQVQAAPPTTDATTTYNGASAARGPDAPAKGLTLVGGSWYAGRIDNKTWGVDAKDDKEIDFLALGPGMSYVQLQARSNNTDGYPINVVTAKQLRQTERGTLAVSDPSRYKAPTETPSAMFYAEDWADHATGAEGDCTTSSVHPVIPWIVASVTDGNWGNVAFATFDENGRLVQETRENVQITQATSEDANLYMTSKNLNYGTAGGDYTINSLYISNGGNNRWLGADRTLRIKSGGLILQGSSAIGLPGRTDNGALVLGDATHPAYVWAKAVNANTNYLGAAVTAAGGFVSAYPGNLCLVGDQTGIADEIAVNGGTLSIGTAAADCALAEGIPIRVCTGASLLLPTETNAVAASPIKLDGAGKNRAKVILPVNQTCASLAVRDVYESTEWTTLPAGTYGSSASAAEFVRDDLFVGPGTLRIGPAAPTTDVMLLIW